MALWDRCVQGKDFWQNYLDGADKGVCFRLTYKWMACQLRNNKQFKFGWWNNTLNEDMLKKNLGVVFANSHADKKDDRPTPNMKNVVKKNSAYLDSIRSVEGPDKPYLPFRDATIKSSCEFLKQWGGKSGKLDVSYEIVGDTLRSQHASAAMLVGLYGDSKSDGPWAHATGFVQSPQRIAFFDPNGGEFEWRGNPNFELIFNEIGDEMKNTYGTGEYELNEYVLFKVKIV